MYSNSLSISNQKILNSLFLLLVNVVVVFPRKWLVNVDNHYECWDYLDLILGILMRRFYLIHQFDELNRYFFLHFQSIVFQVHRFFLQDE